MKTGNRGFTFVELLVVVSIIGMLSSVVLVAVQGARDKGIVGAGLKFASYNYHYVGAYSMLQMNFDNNITDFSPNAYAVTNTSGTYQSDTPTGAGKSMSFTGASAGVTVTVTPNVPVNSPNGLQDYTASIWIKPTGNFTDNQIVYYANGCAARCVSFQIIADPGDGLSTGAILIGPNDNTFNSDMLLSAPAYLTLNKWQNITYTYVPGTSGGRPTFKIYVNGKTIYSGLSNKANTTYNGTISQVTVGTALGGSAPFEGDIDDFAIYKQALSDAQVEQVYAEGAAKHDLALK